jgi:hypothetical protein
LIVIRLATLVRDLVRFIFLDEWSNDYVLTAMLKGQQREPAKLQARAGNGQVSREHGWVVRW